MEKWIKFWAYVSGAVSGYLFGGWSELVGFLLFLMAVDYGSGIVAAAREAYLGKGAGLSSAVGMIGLAKKVMIVALVAVCAQADGALGDVSFAGLALSGKHVLRDGAAAFYCANELLSIMENAGRIGVPVPGFIKQIVAVFKKMADKPGATQ